jgi:DNA-binding LacI/PurR family transcriptional regulator/signal transduction histidine kinase/ActR/RegA family two-component response regulator
MHFAGSYQAQVQHAVDAKCRELDLELLVVFGGAIEEPNAWSAAQNAIFELLHPDRVDGLVLLSSTLATFTGAEGVERLVRRCARVPVCSLGVELPGVPSIVVDNRQGMEAAVEHMLREHGCRKVAHIGGSLHSPEAEIRAAVYRSCLERFGIAWDPALVASGYFTLDGGHAAIEEILARGVEIDAVVAANDAMATGAIAALRQHGYRVPRDLPVTGFDDLPMSRLGNPPLTTVAQPFEAMADRALGLVLEQLQGSAVPLLTRLPAEFVVRHSCGCDVRAQRARLHTPSDDTLDPPGYLRKQAGAIWSALVRAMQIGASDGSRDAARLVSALEMELAGQTGAFLDTIEEILEEANNDHTRCRALQNATTCLREHFRRFASPGLEDLWHDTRDLIELSSTRGQLQRRIELDGFFERLLQAGENVSRTLDLASLQKALLRILPALKVHTALLSRYSDNSGEELEPFVCLVDGQAREPEVRRFAAHQLFPPGVLDDEPRRTLLVFPLVFETQRLGVAAFEHSAEATGYPLLRDQVSVALSSIRLHGEVIEKTMLHERSVQERLATAKRMQSLSVLAGGVAHDLNNALGPLVALPDVILGELSRLASPEETLLDVRTDVESIKAAALRASQTIKDLLTLGRQGRTTKEPLNLNDAVSSCLRSDALSRLTEASRTVGIQVDLYPEPLVICASEAHLGRAITNLVRNGMEAISGEGQVVVRTFASRLPTPISGYEVIEPGRYAVVSVSDNGSGIAAAELGRVFEPFFSKKRMGENSGTGLGLAIVHGVVKEHEGFLDVASTVGMGTTFTLYFPRAEADVQVRERGVVSARGHAKILIVDDEPVQLRTGRRVLTHLGYQVDTVESGRKARELFERAAPSGNSPYDVVILDMLLNESQDGLELLEQIQRMFPKQRAILASGHAPTERAELAVQRGLTWLVKPYTADALASAVHGTLADHPSHQVVRLSYRPVADLPQADP